MAASFPHLTPLKRFLNVLKVDKQDVLSIYVYALFNGVISLSLPLGIQAIINLISTGQVSTSWIVLVIVVIAGVAGVGIMQIMQLSIAENLQQKIFTRSAFEFAYRIPRLKLETIDNMYIPELVNRFFDTISVQKGLSKILMDFSSETLQVFFGLILLSIYHPFFILFSFLLLAIVYLIFKFTVPNGLKTSLKESKHKYEVEHWLEELARTMETFKLAGKSPMPLQKTDEVVQDYLGARKAHFKTLLIQYINLVGFKVFIAAGLLIIGGLLVMNQKMNIGQFVASEIIIILVLASVEKLILSMETIYDVLTAIEKIGTVTDLPLDNNEGHIETLRDDEGINIHVDKLFLGLGTKGGGGILEGINLRVQAGEKLCLSGYYGSGKSVLLQVIAALYSDYTGVLSYNGVPLSNWDTEYLRSLIGDSLTNEDIFMGTILENITLKKPDIGLDEIRDIADVIGLTDFMESLPEGYNTMLNPEGKKLPKSIRLKIMLVRCLVGQPKIILLEDNFNQLRMGDKLRLLHYLEKSKSTVILSSNDPKIAQHFQRMLVLSKGHIVADGDPKDVVNDSKYSELFQTS